MISRVHGSIWQGIDAVACEIEACCVIGSPAGDRPGGEGRRGKGWKKGLRGDKVPSCH